MVLTSLTPPLRATVPHLTTHPISGAQSGGDRNGNAYGTLRRLIPSKNQGTQGGGC